MRNSKILGVLMGVCFLVISSGVAFAAGDAEHKGVPLDAKPDLVLWSIVVFLIFLAVLRSTAWGPLTKGLDERESRIREDIANAEAARVKSERLLAEHAAKLDQAQEEIREMLAKGRSDTEKVKQDILAEARSEAETLRERAVDDINRARDQALNELFDVMSNQVAIATEHVLGRALGDQDQDRLIGEALTQFAGRANG
ncbi:MAG: F0F1 ATP synthase subunit B [Planctomycetota bacterium]|nr:F0F1 ATP synthase subunit B [Planctomycetota bacterium]